jgi:competence protein ComEA
MSKHLPKLINLAGLAALLAIAPPAPLLADTTLEGVVNINTASNEELELLPGVGPAKARLIASYRQQHAFRTVEELARVKGIGPRTVRRLRPHLVVRGPTTARPTPRRPIALTTPAPPPTPAPTPPTASTPAPGPAPTPAAPSPPSPKPAPSPQSPAHAPRPPSPRQPDRATARATSPGPRCTAIPCLPPP